MPFYCMPVDVCICFSNIMAWTVVNYESTFLCSFIAASGFKAANPLNREMIKQVD